MNVYEIHAKSQGFAARVAETQRVMRELPKLGACVVSTSWGKDSTALAHLALEVWGSVDLFHMPYSLLPGYEEVVKAAESDSRVRVHRLEVPGQESITLADVVEFLREHGLAHEWSRAKLATLERTRNKRWATDWACDRGFRVVCLGLRAAESRSRRMHLLSHGMTYRKSEVPELWHSNPLAWWSHRDLWAYIFSRGLVYAEVYDRETHGLTRETIRSGGWINTDGAALRGTIAWLRFHFPDAYRELTTHFPEMASYA